MSYTREELAGAAVKMTAFADRTEMQGRKEDAQDLRIAAACCRQAANRISERVASANGNWFADAKTAPDKTADAEPCPFSQHGICIGCAWKDVQWFMNGCRYECLTQSVCRSQRELYAAFSRRA